VSEVPKADVVEPFGKVVYWDKPDGSGRVVQAFIPMEKPIEGAKMGLAIDGSGSMQNLFGRPPRAIIPSTPNHVQPVARLMSAYLAKKAADGRVTTIYWATGPGGKDIQELGDLTVVEAEKHDFPPPNNYGTGTQLVPALQYFTDGKQRPDLHSAVWGMYVFITDGAIEDMDAIEQYCTQLAKDIDAGRRNDLKLVIIGLGDQIDEEQLDRLDDLETDTEVDLWDAKLATEMQDLSELFTEVVDERTIIAAGDGVVKDDSGDVVMDYRDTGLPSILRFTLPAGTTSFTLEVGGWSVAQPLPVKSAKQYGVSTPSPIFVPDSSKAIHAWTSISAELTSMDHEAFGRRVLDLTEHLCSRLQLQRLFEKPVSYRQIDGLVLDVTPVVADTKLPTRLPLLFLRRMVLREEDLKYSRYLLEERLRTSSKIALLMLFAEKPRVQEAQKMVETLRTSYAYDIIPIGNTELRQLVLASDPQRALRSMLLRNVNLATVAPFVTTGPTPVTMFFGRESEMRSIAEHAKAASYAVISGRRFGKTSILSCLHRVRLPTSGFRTLYHDCSTTPTYDAFLATVIRDWGPGPPADALTTYEDLLQALPVENPLVLLLDEADKLVPADRAHEWRLFSTLRGLANSGRVLVVLSGERMLRGVLRDPESPLFNFANEILLGPLDYHAVEELVTRPMKQLEIELVDEGTMVRRIYGFTSGHPNVVQRLCSRLIKRLNEQGTRRITLGDVDAVIADPKFQEEDFLGTYWERATPLEQIISLVMAQEAKPYRLQAVLDLLAVHGLQPEPEVVRAALDRLVDLRSILKRSQAGYAFAVESFPRVVADTTTAEDLLIVLKSQYLKNPMELAE